MHVELWRVRLDEERSDAPSPLSAAENARAERLRIPDVRRRFIAARSALRRILGGQLGIDPAAVEILAGINGKPKVGAVGSDLEFNLSHSGEWMVVALCHGHPVGVDIESANARLRAREIADRYFTPRENESLRAGSETDYARSFLQLWTAKEAVMKATALGVARGLGEVEICLNPLSCIRPPTASGSPWQLTTLDVADGVVGTLATPEAATLSPLRSLDEIAEKVKKAEKRSGTNL